MKPGIIIRDAQPADSAAIESLLRDSALPLEGVGEVQFAVAEHGGRVIGSAGLEIHGDSGLLRSVAVAADWRRHGVGEALVRAVLDAAAVCKLDPVVLLTTTAPDWFPRFGFERIERREVPQPLLESVEFTRACPATAIVMRCSLAAAQGASTGRT